MDRRVKKNRKAILQAYQELIKDKDSIITVQKICEKADIGRSTFYLHFSDRDSLPLELCEELFVHVGTQTPDELPVGERAHHLIHMLTPENEPALWRLMRLSVHLMKHMDRERAFYGRMFDNNNEVWFYQAFRTAFKRFLDLYVLDTLVLVPSNFPRELYISFMFDSFCTVVKWSYQPKTKTNPQEMGYYYMCLITNNFL